MLVRIAMKRKIIFGALWGLVGLTVFGLMTKYDSSAHFPYTNWLAETAKVGYLFSLAAESDIPEILRIIMPIQPEYKYSLIGFA